LFYSGQVGREAFESWRGVYFVGVNEKTIQGRALKPRGWMGGQEKKYLVVLLIHGGPQGAWEDGWSTRWNPNGMRFIFSLAFGL